MVAKYSNVHCCYAVSYLNIYVRSGLLFCLLVCRFMLQQSCLCFALEILFGIFVLNRNRLNCHLNGEVRKTFILFSTEKENLKSDGRQSKRNQADFQLGMSLQMS